MLEKQQTISSTHEFGITFFRTPLRSSKSLSRILSRWVSHSFSSPTLFFPKDQRHQMLTIMNTCILTSWQTVPCATLTIPRMKTSGPLPYKHVTSVLRVISTFFFFFHFVVIGKASPWKAYFQEASFTPIKVDKVSNIQQSTILSYHS